MKDHEDWNTVFLSRHTRQPVTLRVNAVLAGVVHEWYPPKEVRPRP